MRGKLYILATDLQDLLFALVHVKLKRELFVVRLLAGLQKTAFNMTFISVLCLSCKQDLNRGVLLLQRHTQQCTASDAAELFISARFGVFLTSPP